MSNISRRRSNKKIKFHDNLVEVVELPHEHHDKPHIKPIYSRVSADKISKRFITKFAQVSCNLETFETFLRTREIYELYLFLEILNRDLLGLRNKPKNISKFLLIDNILTILLLYKTEFCIRGQQLINEFYDSENF